MKNWVNPYNDLSLRKNCVVFFMAVSLAGYSTIPTALNPVDWYKGARDTIMGDNMEKKEKSEQNCTLITYSVARIVKDNLEKSSWKWQKISPSKGDKKNWLKANLL